METIPFIEFSLYQMFHLFIFWSFIGWGIEVCYMTLETGEYQNRGFLNMPICPIYGFGVLMVTVFFRPLSNTLIPLFIVTSVLCTTFELLVGLGMEKMFGARWWDYSQERFNFKGYICAKVSILWGLGCVIVIRLVEPMVERIVDSIPVKLGLALIVMWSVLIVIDLVSSICAVNELNNRLRQIDEISNIMLLSASKLGGRLSQETLDVKDKYDKLVEVKDAGKQVVRDKYDAGKQAVKDKYGAGKQAIRERYEKIVNAADFKLSDWEEKYDKLINLRDHSVERLLRAFPYIRSTSYNTALETLKKRWKELYHKGAKSLPETVENTEPIAVGSGDVPNETESAEQQEKMA